MSKLRRMCKIARMSLQLLSTAAVADAFGVTTRTVHRWAASGLLIPAVIVPGYRGDLLFDPDAVAELIETRNHAKTR